MHERCCDVVEHYAARTLSSVARCSKTDDHPQGLQGGRSSVHVVSHVSCHLGCNEPAFHSTVLHIINESATDRFLCLAAEPSLGSRTMHLVNTASTALVRDLLPPFDHPSVRWFSDCTRVLEALTRQRSGLCKVCQAFSIDTALLSLLVPTTFSFVVVSPDISARFGGTPAASS